MIPEVGGIDRIELFETEGLLGHETQMGEFIDEAEVPVQMKEEDQQEEDKSQIEGDVEVTLPESLLREVPEQDIEGSHCQDEQEDETGQEIPQQTSEIDDQDGGADR